MLPAIPKRVESTSMGGGIYITLNHARSLLASLAMLAAVGVPLSGALADTPSEEPYIISPKRPGTERVSVVSSKSGTRVTVTKTDPEGVDRITSSFDTARRGVLIKLSERPLAAVSATARQASGGTSFGADEVLSAEQRIDQEQDDVGRAIEAALGSPLGFATGSAQSTGSTRSPRVQRFKTAFNGFAVRGISEKEAREKLARIPGITIYPIRELRANLNHSVDFIGASKVWRRTAPDGKPLDGTGVSIGIIDTGVDYSHPDLGGCFGKRCKVAGGYDFINDDSDPFDDHGHGTHVAATAAGLGISRDRAGRELLLPGVAPGATIYAFKVLSKSGAGDDASVLGGIERCIDPNNDRNFEDHLDVCSMSLGGSGSPDDPLSAAVDHGVAVGSVFTIAAGNEGPEDRTIGSPGTARDAITVTAACEAGSKDMFCQYGPIAVFSSRGPIPDFPSVTKPDIAAPGVEICAAATKKLLKEVGRSCLDDKHASISGTSMATPHVAGVAALMIQANRRLIPSEIKALMLGTAKDLGEPRAVQGTGLINALAAVEAASGRSKYFRFTGAPIIQRYSPNRMVQSFEREVVVKNISLTPRTLSPPAQLTLDGVSLRFAEGSVTLAPNESATYHIAITVDHGLVKTNTTHLRRFAWQGDEGGLPLYVSLEVGSRFEISGDSVDFGLAPGNSEGFSQTATLTVRNLILDGEASLILSTECCSFENYNESKGGVSFQPSSSVLSIPAGGTAQALITVSVANSTVQNGTYGGKLLMSSPLEAASVQLKLFKGYRVKVMHEGEPPHFVDWHGPHQDRFFERAPTGERFVYAREPGEWLVESLWFDEVTHGTDSELQTLTVGDSPNVVTISRSTVKNRLNLVVPAANGEPLSIFGLVYKVELRKRGTSTVNLLYDGTLPNQRPYRFNDLDERFVISAAGYATAKAGESPQPGTLFTVHHTEGLHSDLTLRTGPPKPLTVVAWDNDSTGAPFRLMPAACVRDIRSFDVFGGMVCTPYFLPIKGTRGKPITFTTASSESPGSAETSFADIPAVMFLATTELTPPFNPLFSSPNIYPGAQGTFTFFSAGDPVVPRLSQKEYIRRLRLRPVHDGVVALGAGPYLDRTRTYNVGGLTNLIVPSYSGVPFDLSGTSTIGPDPAPLTTVSFSRDGAKIDTPELVEGEEPLAEFLPRSLMPVFRLPRMASANGPVKDITVPGTYTYSAEILGKLLGMPTINRSKSTFTIPSDPYTLIDSNPPSLISLHLENDQGFQQAGIDPNTITSIEFAISPNPGLGAPITDPNASSYNEEMPDELKSLTVEQSRDGKSWIPLTVTSKGEQRYSAKIESKRGIKLYHFRIKASDSSSNSFSYTFMMPAGQAFSLQRSSSDPISVSIEGIRNNKAIAGAKSAIRIHTKNLISAISCDLLVNGVVTMRGLTCEGARPNTIQWSKLPRGKISVQVRVEDVTGTVGLSPIITVKNPKQYRR